MAKLLKSRLGNSKDKVLSRKAAAPAVELPEEYEEPRGELNDFSLLIHGEKKIGKTTLALEGGKSLILQFDPPQLTYRRLEIHCPSWEKFMAALKQLELRAKQGTFPYNRVVVDRADMWFRHAQKSACFDLGIDHPSEESWGKGWDAVRTRFMDAVDRLLSLPCGKWFLCHSEWKEVETRHGAKINKLLPNLPGTAEEILNGKVDGWFAYDYEGRYRALTIRGDDRTGAGHRINGHFETPSGLQVRTISMGKSAREGYRNLVKAFENLQPSPNPFVKSE